MSDAGPQRRIWLCADDYGLSPGVNRGIRDLIARRRLNATSLMVVGPAVDHDEIEALKAVAAGNPACAIGLHAVMTAPFHPLTMPFKPLEGSLFPPLAGMLRRSIASKLDGEMIAAEFAAQIAAFRTLMGRAPDYVDGHQHVHIFPQIRTAFLAAVAHHAPGAWVRQCGRAHGRRPGSPKALLLDVLSRKFRRKAAQAGVSFNPGFAGAYDFTRQPEFGPLMESFLDDLPDGGLVMCHPGFVDDVLISLDPLAGQREREYAYLAGDEFIAMLSRNGVALR